MIFNGVPCCWYWNIYLSTDSWGNDCVFIKWSNHTHAHWCRQVISCVILVKEVITSCHTQTLVSVSVAFSHITLVTNKLEFTCNMWVIRLDVFESFPMLVIYCLELSYLDTPCISVISGCSALSLVRLCLPHTISCFGNIIWHNKQTITKVMSCGLLIYGNEMWQLFLCQCAQVEADDTGARGAAINTRTLYQIMSTDCIWTPAYDNCHVIHICNNSVNVLLVRQSLSTFPFQRIEHMFLISSLPGYLSEITCLCLLESLCGSVSTGIQNLAAQKRFHNFIHMKRLSHLGEVFVVIITFHCFSF